MGDPGVDRVQSCVGQPGGRSHTSGASFYAGAWGFGATKSGGGGPATAAARTADGPTAERSTADRSAASPRQLLAVGSCRYRVAESVEAAKFREHKPPDGDDDQRANAAENDCWCEAKQRRGRS